MFWYYIMFSCVCTDLLLMFLILSEQFVCICSYILSLDGSSDTVATRWGDWPLCTVKFASYNLAFNCSIVTVKHAVKNVFLVHINVPYYRIASVLMTMHISSFRAGRKTLPDNLVYHARQHGELYQISKLTPRTKMLLCGFSLLFFNWKLVNNVAIWLSLSVRVFCSLLPYILMLVRVYDPAKAFLLSTFNIRSA